MSKAKFFDADYWAVVSDSNDMAWNIRRTRTEVIKAFCGPEAGYQQRWRRVKKWTTHPRIVRVKVSWNRRAKENGVAK